MATLETLTFELERRSILFHKDTSMPDETQLGYNGDPNLAVNGNTDGETLIYNSPSGTRYLNKSVTPYEIQDKVEDGGGGLQIKAGSSDSTNIPTDITNVEIINFSLNIKSVVSQYLKYNNIYSNITGYIATSDKKIKSIFFQNTNAVSGANITISLMSGTVLYSFVSTNTFYQQIPVNIDLTAGQEVKIFIKSSIAIGYPIIKLELI